MNAATLCYKKKECRAKNESEKERANERHTHRARERDGIAVLVVCESK